MADFKLKKWYCLLTDKLDEFRIYKGDFNKTYLYGYEDGIEAENNIVPIRVPGATRGYVQIDENKTIIKVVIGEDAYKAAWACYEKEVLDILDSFKGQKLDIPIHKKGEKQ